jgi:hypothetical protein
MAFSSSLALREATVYSCLDSIAAGCLIQLRWVNFEYPKYVVNPLFLLSGPVFPDPLES